MSRARRTLAATVTMAVASMTLTGCFEEPSAHEAVRDFLVGWQSGDYDLAASRTDANPAVVRKALADTRLDLDAASFRFKIEGLRRDGEESQADFHAEVDLGENNPLWEYDSKLPLRLVNGRWVVRWSPSVLHPQLREGQRFAVDPQSGSRKPVLDRNRNPLQRDTTLYVAGVFPALLGDNAEKVCEQLAAVTGFAQDRLLSRIRSAPPREFVQLVTFGKAAYRDIEAKLKAIPGIKVTTQSLPLAPDSPQQIVGSVSALTPDTMQKLGGPQRAGDSFGKSGLQAAYQDQLTGATQISVVTLDLKTGEEVAKLQEWRPERVNVSVSTTLDSSVQAAADAAVTGLSPSVLVAVKASTGEVMAVGAHEMHQEKDALAGKFPAGTAFSIIAADALLQAGVKPTQKLSCPAERSVGGAKFQQTGLPAGTSPTFQSNFAQGCVTALASLARRVDGAALVKSATAFGIGSGWKLPLKSFSGKMPALTTDADKARAIAGQTVTVSPLAMALVAGAVQSGTWHPPLLVTNPDSPDPVAETLPTSPPAAVPVARETLATLRTMMRAGASPGGTASAAGVVGQPVFGINAVIPGDRKQRTWFVGWQGDVAVAVLAANTDPAAIAGRFFGALRNPR